VTMDGEDPRMGSDSRLKIILINGSSEQRSISLHGQVAVMYYTGVHKATVCRDRAEVDLPPNGGESSVFKYCHVVRRPDDAVYLEASLRNLPDLYIALTRWFRRSC